MEGWSHADTTFLVALLVFGAIGALRGFVRSIFGLVAIGFGFFVAAFFYRDGAGWIFMVPVNYQTRCTVAFILLAFFGFAFVRLIGGLFQKTVQGAILSFMNRVVGFLFGLLQGFALVLIAVTVALLSPSPDKFHTWASQGVIAPPITSLAEFLAGKTRTATKELRAELIQQMVSWGVKESALDKIFDDPELMKEIVKQGSTTKAPDVTAPSDDVLYGEIQVVIDNDMLNTQQKAREIWRLILQSHQNNSEANPAKPDNTSRTLKP